MPIECDNCSRCHKFGLLIHPVRYAIGLKYDPKLAAAQDRFYEQDKDKPEFQMRHGQGTPALSGPFRATGRHPDIPLGDGTQYSLRRLRNGYVYVINDKDPLDPLRCYEISENGLLTEVASSLPKRGPIDERRDVACSAHKNQMTAESLTIPFPDEAEEVWITFSDTKWTPEVEKQHEDPAHRARHMRKVNVSEWMKSANPQHEHAMAISRLDPKNPLIAEYASDHPAYALAFSFSEAKFNQKAGGVDLARAAEELNKAGITLSQPPKDEEIPIIQAFLMNRGTLTEAQRAGIAASPFERFIEEVGRFYERAHGGAQKNAPYRGKGMILALDDPAGIAQDLNGLISSRLNGFGKSDEDRRLMAVNGCVESIRAGLMKGMARDVAKKYKDAASTSRYRPPSQETKEEIAAILEGDSRILTEAFEEAWKDKYEPKLDVDKRQELLDDYASRFAQFRKDYVQPLAEAHAKWMESECMVNSFACNFEPNKTREAREQSGGYVELFSRCVGTTAEQEASSELYVKWLTTAPCDEKNLLWRAICCNSDAFANEVIPAGARIEEAQRSLAAASWQFASAPPSQSVPVSDEHAQNMIGWSKTWFGIIAMGQEEITKALSSNAESTLKELERARTAFDQAQKEAADLHKSRETIAKQEARKMAQYQDRVDKLSDMDKGYLVQKSPQYAALQSRIVSVRRSLNIVVNPAMNRLIWQMKGPFAKAGKLAHDGAAAPNFPHFRRVISAYNGTPCTPLTLRGAPVAVGLIPASRLRQDYSGSRQTGVIGTIRRGLSAVPKETLIASRYYVAASSDFLFQAFSVATLSRHELRGITELMGGTFSIRAENAHGAASSIWQMDYKQFEKHVGLQRQQTQLDELTRITHERMALAEAGQKVDKLQAGHAQNLAAAEAELARLQKDITEKSRFVERSKSLTEKIDRGYPTVNLLFAGLAFWSLGKQLEKVGEKQGAADTEYSKAVSLYYASSVAVIGAGVELAYKSLLAAPVVRNLKWARFLRSSARVATSVRLIGGVLAAPLAVVQAYWDWDKVTTARGNKQYVWAIAYGTSAALGLGTAALGVLFALKLVAAPIVIGVAILYAVVSLAIYIFAPNETQEWLDKSLFGKNPDKRYKEDWKNIRSDENKLEIVNFRRLGLAPQQ